MIQLQDMDDSSYDSKALLSNDTLNHFPKLSKQKTICRLNCVICLNISILISLLTLIISLIILGIYVAPMANAITPVVDQIKSLNLSGLNSLSESSSEIVMTIRKFKKVDMDKWNVKLNSIDSINNHLYQYDTNISVIMSYLRKFDDILKQLNNFFPPGNN